MTDKNRKVVDLDIGVQICTHMRALGHRGLGVTELRAFIPHPLVAYVDNEDAAVELCREVAKTAPGIYAGVQPRMPHLFDLAPNRWVLARGGGQGNCGKDETTEFLEGVYFDIDVVSEMRKNGHPASEEELTRSLHAAQLLTREDGFALCSTICCSGNGHYVLARIPPIAIDSDEIVVKFKQFCWQIAKKVGDKTPGVRFDPVYNLSRVMRVMGTMNRKGQPAPGRPHRRAYFVTEPVFDESVALHHMILNTEVEQSQLPHDREATAESVKCDLKKIEKCCFIQYCRKYPEQVTEPQWWGMITNLARLEGGPALIHEISRLDRGRYDYAQTERLIRRVLESGYRPVSCQTLISSAGACPQRGRFICPRMKWCPARAPIYMTSLKTI